MRVRPNGTMTWHQVHVTEVRWVRLGFGEHPSAGKVGPARRAVKIIKFVMLEIERESLDSVRMLCFVG